MRVRGDRSGKRSAPGPRDFALENASVAKSHAESLRRVVFRECRRAEAHLPAVKEARVSHASPPPPPPPPPHHSIVREVPSDLLSAAQDAQTRWLVAAARRRLREEAARVQRVWRETHADESPADEL